MITLPVTCNQVWIIFACIVFLIGLFFVISYYDNLGGANIVLFTAGLFMVGLPSALGIGAFVWCTGVFIDKHVRCKCDR